MKSPLQITFRHMPVSAALSSNLRQRVARLERFCSDIVGAHVVIETPHHRHQQGRRFHVRLELSVPGERIIISREPEARAAYEDVHVAVRDTFEAARRRLEDYQRRRRGQ